MTRPLSACASALTVLAIAALPARAQSLEQRLPADGEATFSFAAQPDVCGDGENILRLRENRGDGIDFIRSRGSMRGVHRSDSAHVWLGRCEFGPVHVRLSLERRAIASADVRVGGNAAVPSGAVDIGRVAAAAAVEFLLGPAVRAADRRTAGELLLAAVLADSVETWPALLEIARDEGLSRDLRQSALFWVSTAAAEKATDGLVEIARDDDEDLEIRKHALFGLSRRPDDEGVPLLIEVVRTTQDPELIRTALFWLGRSRDPRAIALFREILTR